MNKENMIKQHLDYVEKKLASKPGNMTEHEEWLFNRQIKGLGGSEIGTIMGLNPYQDAYDLWLIKTGRTEPDDLSDNPAIHFGHVLEDVVAKEYARRTNEKVRISNKHYSKKEHPWMVANVDRLVVGQRKILECKTAGAFVNQDAWGESGTDHCPESYITQCAHYMAVLDYDSSDLAVLIGGRDFRIYNLQRDLELEQIIIDVATDFWFNHVIADIPPEVTKPEKVWTRDNGDSIEANESIAELISDRNEVVESIKELTDIKKGYDKDIQMFMQDNQVLTYGDSKLATWKSSERNSVDSKRLKADYPDVYADVIKTSNVRTLRVK